MQANIKKYKVLPIIADSSKNLLQVNGSQLCLSSLSSSLLISSISFFNSFWRLICSCLQSYRIYALKACAPSPLHVFVVNLGVKPGLKVRQCEVTLGLQILSSGHCSAPVSLLSLGSGHLSDDGGHDLDGDNNNIEWAGDNTLEIIELFCQVNLWPVTSQPQKYWQLPTQLLNKL